ncbi:Hypothetical predicted protein [Olea europaea subsp. europaea]|uniref:Uncharacterized protein n=1 Tax=Olea europaea subsp. europaea TaxID=158383 RepID=A0A8S0UPR2_OLEEU|nr:Hypothetical predicted protein [Olea europaea subsp. europaea]
MAGILTSDNTYAKPILQVDQATQYEPTDTHVTSNKAVNPNLQSNLQTANSNRSNVNSNAEGATHDYGPQSLVSSARRVY